MRTDEMLKVEAIVGELSAEIERLRAREKLLDEVIQRQALGLMKIRTMQGDPVQIAREAMDCAAEQKGSE